MANAKEQTWWLARDKCVVQHYIASTLPLINRSQCSKNHFPVASGEPGYFKLYEADEWETLTKGQYPLEPGAKPREVLLKLVVKDVKTP